MNTESLRLFTAIPLPDAVRRVCVSLQENLGKTGADVRWVSPENMHVTLVFLGDTKPDKLNAVMDALDRRASELTAFTAVTGEAGWFGARRSPRVLWLGLQRADALDGLCRELRQHLADAGFAMENRKFHPHITLGRVRSSRGAAELTSAMESTKMTAVGYDVPVDRAVLIRSTLSPQGSKYTILHETPLKGAG